MKSRFFYGMFVGFVVASLFFFFFFRVARAQTPTPSPQKLVGAYQSDYRVETSEIQYDDDMATDYVTNNYKASTSYPDEQASYNNRLAGYGGYNDYHTAVSYYGRAKYGDTYATYENYRPVTYAGIA